VHGRNPTCRKVHQSSSIANPDPCNGAASMPPPEFPRRLLAPLQELGARALESRKPKSPSQPFARELLAGFHDLCMRSGLDRTLVELEQVHPPLDASDSSTLSDHPTLLPALVARLDALDLDGGGPRNLKPVQIADAVVSSLGLALSDDVPRTIELDGSVRSEVAAALARAVNGELALPRLRETIISHARERCEERFLGAFEKIVAQLDERGMRMTKQPKVPLDASQAIQRQLVDTRNAVLGRIAGAAIDGAQQVISRANAEAAARIDQPITHKLTPREVGILRACDPRLPKLPAVVVESLLESLTELASLAWRAPEQAARVYAPTAKFAVGELVEHPKFGRGSVVSVAAQRVEIEFADGRHTLVHGK
jgi:hypothetical protein